MVKICNKFKDRKYKEVFYPETRVKHKDYFHLKDFYRMLHDYMVDHEFTASNKDQDFPEIWYSHQWDQTRGEEIHFWWRFVKVKNEYFAWEVDVDVNIYNMKRVEIMKKGVKYKAVWGEPEVKIFGRIVVDRKGEWSKSWLLKGVHELFWKRIWWHTFLKHKKDLINEVYRYEEHIKTYFKMVTYSSEPEGESYTTSDEFD